MRDINVMYSSAKDDWETPQEFFDTLNSEFGFTVDVAASDSNAKCSRYYTKAQNGLSQDWTGETVWCNPPYGKPVTDFVRKAAQSKALTVMLIPARTDTRWFHDYIYNKENVKIRFVKGRIKFGGVQTAPLFRA